jgi:hypothetical protein
LFGQWAIVGREHQKRNVLSGYLGRLPALTEVGSYTPDVGGDVAAFKMSWLIRQSSKKMECQG